MMTNTQKLSQDNSPSLAIKLPTAIGLAFGAVVGALVFSLFYQGFIDIFTFPRWVSAGIGTTALALAFTWMHFRMGVTHFHQGNLKFYVPALIIVIGSMILAILTRLFVAGAPDALVSGLPGYIGLVLWIPLVEEIVFRAGVGPIFRKYGGLIWGGWFSALLFAMAHTLPSMSDLSGWQLGVPMGPFLLGACCEYFYVKSKSIWPCVVFHGACNATPLIFYSIDSRWLQWLQILYS